MIIHITYFFTITYFLGTALEYIRVLLQPDFVPTVFRLTTISTRRQKQGFVSLRALRGVFGFGSLIWGALVK